MTKFEHCLINEINDLSNRKTGLIINDTYILAPGTIISNCIDEHIIKRLENFELITVVSSAYDELYRKKFVIIRQNGRQIYQTFVTIHSIFNCQRINETIDKILIGMQQSPSKLHDRLPISCFALFQINQKILAPKINLLSNQLSIISSKKCKKLDDIYSVTIPFANEIFFRTINVGKIANILINNDDSQSLMIGSMALVHGCEGGGIYDREHELIGIILMTSFRWKNEIGLLTLIGKFSEIINEFLEQSKLSSKHDGIRSIMPHIDDATNSIINKNENSVVMIQVDQSWGTGCLIKINNWKIVITCGHVVWNNNNSIKCTWKKGCFNSEIIYKNPRFNHPYDIAILSVPNTVPDEYFAEYAKIPSKVAQRIYSIGFPHFSTLATQIFSPSIYEGRITKIDIGMLLTDVSTQAGQSGGPLFNEAGQLVGISVSNSKIDDMIYPHLNMAIPMTDIYPALEIYVKSNDSRSFNSLVADRTVKSVWALEPPNITSKL